MGSESLTTNINNQNATAVMPATIEAKRGDCPLKRNRCRIAEEPNKLLDELIRRPTYDL